MFKNTKTKRIFATVIVVLLVIAMVVTSVISALAEETSSAEKTIVENVMIGNIQVGGMTSAEAEAAIADYVAQINEGTTILEGDLGDVEISNSELGLTCDASEAVEAAMAYGRTGNLLTRYKQRQAALSEPVQVPCTVALASGDATTVLRDHEDEIIQTAEPYKLERIDGEFQITEGQAGTVIDMEASVEALQNFYANEYTAENNRIAVSTKEEDASNTKAELEKVQDLLGTYTTSYNSGAGRGTNIETGASLINGSVLFPGEELSADALMRPYDADHGYTLGGAYVNGKVEQSYGGGICQVSTTLYNAALYAELEIVSRQPHSMLVGYVDPARDAAIAGDVKDLKIANNTDAPIYIEAITSGGQLTFNIYGQEYRDANRTVEYESEVLSRSSAGVSYEEDPTLAAGAQVTESTGHSGATANLWKIVYIDGVEVSREKVNYSSYRTTNTIVRVGTMGAAVEEPVAEETEEPAEDTPVETPTQPEELPAVPIVAEPQTPVETPEPEATE